MIEWNGEAIAGTVYTVLFLLLSVVILANAFLNPGRGIFVWSNRIIAIAMTICMLVATISLTVMATTSSYEWAQHASFFREKSLLGFYGCIGLLIVQYLLERIVLRLKTR